MSKSGNKVIAKFIQKDLARVINKVPLDIYYIFHNKYSYKHLGKWIPQYEYIQAGYFVESKYLNRRSSKYETVYYITPFGIAKVTEELKDVAGIGFGKGIGEV